MWNLLYNLIVMPIQIVVEMTYSFMYRLLDNRGLAIIAVSLVIQTLILPLYKRSDALQDEEREKQKSMERWVKHIKKTFKGDERFMMLNTYYRQNDYKPYYALKSSFSILLQIPFFMAAYNYLSHLQELRGVSFLFIKDLGAPDHMFHIGGFYVNFLPIAMTLINIVSGIIYTKGLPVKSKLQVYGLAEVFLVLLYNSPAGLVLYWTMNNIYSLLKNVFMKLVKLPKHSLGVRLKERLFRLPDSRKLFVTEQIILTVLLGAFIPLSIISASATEFLVDGKSPVPLVIHTLSVYVGFFVVWFSIFYYFMSDNARKLFSILLFGVIGTGLFNYMAYSGRLGRMSPMLVYDELPLWSRKDRIVNLVVVVAIFAILWVLVFKLNKLCKQILQICAVCLLAVCFIYGQRVSKAVKQYQNNGGKVSGGEIFALSTEGENVVVIMLDRAINGYVPYIMNEFPEIAEAFSDFTYYPNTISFGLCTNYAAPALFGGYEYTPKRMNERDNEKLVDKHNEAIRVLPAVFSANGYEVTVCDPPYANYQWTPDVSIYDDLEHVNAYVTEGQYRQQKLMSSDNVYRKMQQSNFIYFGIDKLLPLQLQWSMYNVGMYCTTISSSNAVISDAFKNSYTSLVSLKEMTAIREDSGKHFLMLQNSTTHEPVVLKSPDYTPSDDVDWEEELAKQPEHVINGKELRVDDAETLAYYQTNVAALKAVADWLDFLKQKGAYDNTRIIIVSDHGEELGQFGQIDENVDIESFNALLLVKDINASGYSVSDAFMTTADVPYYAVKDIIDNPVNPYTGKVINNDEKYAHPQYITTSSNWDVTKNNGNRFDDSDGIWYQVEGDIFLPSNWKRSTDE